MDENSPYCSASNYSVAKTQSGKYLLQFEGCVFSDDSHSKRDFTVENVILPEKPGIVLVNNKPTCLSEPEVAGILLALVRDCNAFSPPLEAATVVFDGGQVELRFEHKDLRVQFHCEDSRTVTWSAIHDRLYDLPAGTEWLIITIGSLTARAKAEINHANYREGSHYVEISNNLRWQERD
ncbi:hypothetical protein ACOZ4I_20315 (plasmid) [Haloarcula salina]|uniref:hypothetical protein n=1 Tax=Haloarcula salina TaxID=1429914 RepID=UPI003C6FE973